MATRGRNIRIFADATEQARYTGERGGVVQGELSALESDSSLWIYNGTAWVQVGGDGDGDGDGDSAMPDPGTPLVGLKFHADFGNITSWPGGVSTTWTDVIGSAAGTMTDTNNGEGFLNFDGADSLVNFGAVSSDVADIFDSVPGYVEVWAYIESDGEGNAGVLVDAGYGADGTNWLLTVSNEASGFVKITFTHAWSTTDGIWTTTDADFPLETWVCIGVRYHSDSVSEDPSFFINGIGSPATEDQTPVGTPSTATTEDLVIGNHADATGTFDGRIGIVSMWNSSIYTTSTQVTAAYNAKRHRFGHADVYDEALARSYTGYGSTNTRIVRWTTLSGTDDITFTDSATLGTYITIGPKSAGTYAISCTVEGNSVSQLYAINMANALSNTFDSSHIKALCYGGGLHLPAGSMACTLIVGAGQVIWVSSASSGALTSSTTKNTLRVSCVSKPT